MQHISNALLEKWVSRLQEAISKGFNHTAGWDEQALRTFENEYNILMDRLVETGFVEDALSTQLRYTDIQDILRRHEDVVVFNDYGDITFDLKQWSLEDLKEQERHPRTPPQVPPQVPPQGTLLVLSFPIPLQERSAARMDAIIKRIELICSTVMRYLFTELDMKFYFKMDIDARVIDIETGEVSSMIYNFPKDTVWSVRLGNDITNFQKSLKGLLETITKTPLDNTTKKQLHTVNKLKVKVANRQYGGCKNYKSTFANNNRCCKNPGGKDDLCFWRCLAIALHEQTIPTISRNEYKVQLHHPTTQS